MWHSRDVLLLAFEFVRLSLFEAFIVSCFDVVIMHVVSFDHYSYRVQSRHSREIFGWIHWQWSSKRVRLSGWKSRVVRSLSHFKWSVSVQHVSGNITVLYTWQSKTAHS